MPTPLTSPTLSRSLLQLRHQSFRLEDEISLLIHPLRIIRIGHFNVEIEDHLGKDESCLCQENPEEGKGKAQSAIRTCHLYFVKDAKREYLLATHTVPWSGGKRLESLLVVFQEPRVEQGVGLWQETLRVEDAGLDPVGGVVLHVLKIDPNDRLRGEEKVRKCALIRLWKQKDFKTDVEEAGTDVSWNKLSINHLTWRWHDSREIDWSGVVDPQSFVDDCH